MERKKKHTIKLYKRGLGFWRAMAGAALCAALLGSQAAGMLGAAQAAGTDMQITVAQIKAEGKNDQDLATLPSDGSGTFAVDFSKQVTLHIEVQSKLNLENKKVEITVPDGLTVVEYPKPEAGDMVHSVSPENIAGLNSNNTYGGYRPKNGKITYALKSLAEKNSFNIILQPDTVLWNRRNGQTLEQPLEIRVYTGNIDQAATQTTYHKVSAKAQITGKYKNDERAIQTGPRLSTVGVKSGVPTAANTPFALRQIWLNPDKDYIDMPQFMKKLAITIAVPYYEKDGKRVYAKYKEIKFDPAGMSPRDNLLDPKNHEGKGDGFSYNCDADKENTVTLTWENLYLAYGQEYFTPYFYWDTAVPTVTAVKWGEDSLLNTGNTAPGCYLGETPKTGDPSAVCGLITWQDDTTWYPWNNGFNFNKMSFTPYSGEQMTVNGNATTAIYNAYDTDPNITYYLGMFQVVNQGGADSAPKTVEFTYADNNKIGVTAQRIPASSGNSVKVWYKTTAMTEAENPKEYVGTLTSEGGFVTFTAAMADLGTGEYFTTIKANVGSYNRDYVGYVASRSSDPTSGYGATFGKLLTNEADTYYPSGANKYFATMVMYDTGSPTKNTKSGSYNVTVTKTAGQIPPGMEQAYEEGSLNRLPVLSKTTAQGGDTVTFNGLFSSSAYPYSNNNIMTDPVIYIRLPEKITVQNIKLYRESGRMADKVFLSDAVTETETPPRESVTYDLTESGPVDGYKLYKITPENAKVGWFTDTLGQHQIGLSFDMVIAKDAEAMTLDMRDCVRFKSSSLIHTDNTGTLSQYQVPDTYDMNGDLNTTELFSTFNVNTGGTKLSVLAKHLGLTFTFGARAVNLPLSQDQNIDYNPEDYGNYEVDGKKVLLKDDSHAVDLLFTVQNLTGEALSADDARAFYYFIPVPKAGDFWDTHMQNAPFDFDMKLNGKPTVKDLNGTNSNISIKYSTTIESGVEPTDESHYSNKANYVTSDEITNWADVKMILITVKDPTKGIRQNADVKLCMHYVPLFSSNANLVGSIVNFSPCGVSPYSVGTTTNQGHNPLPRIQVEFQTGVIEGMVFLDKNYNGVYDNGDEPREGVQVTVQHSDAQDAPLNPAEDDKENHETTTVSTATENQQGTETWSKNYSFTARRAGKYLVKVTNPGSADKPLKFSLPETGSTYSINVSEDENGRQTAATAIGIEVRKKEASDTDNAHPGTAVVNIGLQEPHTVTFQVEKQVDNNGDYTDEAAATLDKTTEMVWHGTKLSALPKVIANSGYLFTNSWSDGTKTYTDAELKDLAIKEDITFTAQVKKLYSLTYDLNGGAGAAAPETTWLIAGASVTPDYTGTDKLTRGGKTMFVGWSLSQMEILQADATADALGEIITNDAHTMPAHNVTLYAVYAADANGSGTPDYNESAVQVRYHGNNNDPKDIICPHHHVIGEETALSSSAEGIAGTRVSHDNPKNILDSLGNYTFTYGTNIFVGWSTTPLDELNRVIVTPDDYKKIESHLCEDNKVTLLAKAPEGTDPTAAADTSQYADKYGYTNVYAVWAQDRNGNGTADYLESYKLTYDGNAREGGTVTGLPTDAAIYLPGDEVQLSTATPTHTRVTDPADGKEKDVLFLGWTESKVDGIYTRTDSKPKTTTRVTFGGANKTVYAAWGYDEDGKNGPDVLETYSLTYDLNGGSGTVPQGTTNVEPHTKIVLTTEKNFKRGEKEIFVGWSRTQIPGAINRRKEPEPNLITGTEITMETANITLYAVWAEDRNGNKTADYLESYTLTYDGNARNGGTVSHLPSDTSRYIPGDLAPLSTDTPTHTRVTDPADGKEKDVLFLGWTGTKAERIYTRADNEPTKITQVTFGEANQTVYAAWGYDEDGKNGADVLETYSLTYNLNGGSGTVPETVLNLKNKDVKVTEAKGFSRQDNELFIGWSQQARPDALTAAMKQLEVSQFLIRGGATLRIGTASVTLYAVWAADDNRNGTPDYLENFHLTYAGNPIAGGRVDNLPTDAAIYLPGAMAALDTQTIPTHTPVNGKAPVFLGWTTVPQTKIYTWKDPVPPQPVTQVAFDPDAPRDITVYAAWGDSPCIWGEWEHSETQHWKTCTLHGELSGREDHSFQWVTDRQPTGTAPGLKHEECTVCHYKRPAVIIPVLPNTKLPPQTGDASHARLWLFLLALSAMGMGGVWAAGKHRFRHNKPVKK